MSVSRASSTIRKPTFPPEIIGLIVDMVGRGEPPQSGNPGDLSRDVLETLRSCLHVSNTFRRPARKRIFESVTISINPFDDPEYFGRRCDILATLLGMSHAKCSSAGLGLPISKLIQKFVLVFGDRLELPVNTYLERSSLHRVLDYLRVANSGSPGSLVDLRIWVPSSISRVDVPGFHRRALSLIRTAKSIRSLYLYGFKNMPIDTLYGATFDTLLVLHSEFEFEDGCNDLLSSANEDPEVTKNEPLSDCADKFNRTINEMWQICIIHLQSSVNSNGINIPLLALQTGQHYSEFTGRALGNLRESKL